MTAQQTSAQEQLDEARDLWEQFKSAYQELGRSLTSSEDQRQQFEASRIDAYQPGFDPGYDWGMGMSADEWFVEIERSLEPIYRVNPDDDRCPKCEGVPVYDEDRYHLVCEVCGVLLEEGYDYSERVRRLEAEGMTTSDAQAVADAEDMSEASRFDSIEGVRPPHRPVGPCPCECNSGRFCGGCGHAGCGGRR